jgi:hypothetical protein
MQSRMRKEVILRFAVEPECWTGLKIKYRFILQRINETNWLSNRLPRRSANKKVKEQKCLRR